MASVSSLITQVLALATWLAILIAIFLPLERLFALRAAGGWRGDAPTHLGYYFLSSLVPGLVLGVPLALLARGVHAFVPNDFYAAVAALPLWLRIALALVVGEIGFYWGHRITHAVPLLWRFHAVHHSAEHMNFLVNTRAHPVDMVFTRLCGLIPLYMVGLAGPGAAGAAVPVWVLFVGTVWGFFIHANLRWRLGPLEWLVATPAFHHWHHTRHEHIDRNFASMLPVLDRLFGTHHLPREWPGAYGTDTDVGPAIGQQLLRPFQPAADAPPARQPL